MHVAVTAADSFDQQEHSAYHIKYKSYERLELTWWCQKEAQFVHIRGWNQNWSNGLEENLSTNIVFCFYNLENVLLRTLFYVLIDCLVFNSLPNI